jgi:hypothetical protein
MPNIKSKMAKVIIILLNRPIKAAKAVRMVAPSHTANDVSQQQLVPNMKAKTLPKKVFL